MKFKIPFTKGKILDLSVKGESNFYPLTSTGIYPIGEQIFTNKYQSEQQLIDDGYGSNVTVYAIIKKIAEASANIPKKLYDLNNPEEEITEGELYELLKHPGFYQGVRLTQYDYFENIITQLLAAGNTYQRGMQAVGFGDIWQAMEIFPSGIVEPVQKNSYLVGASQYLVTDRQTQFKIDAEEVVHTKFVNPTSLGIQSLEGLSPLQAALYSLTGSSDIQKAISIMVKNQGSRGILTNKGERALTAEEALKMKKSVNKKIRGVENFNSVHVTGVDVNYLNMGMNAADLKLIESGVLTDRQLCNAFSVPSVLFNDPANSTYNNYTTALKSFYTDAVLPVSNKVLSDLNETLLKQYSERYNAEYSWQLDTSGVEALQADQKEEAEKDKIQTETLNTLMSTPITDEAKQLILVTRHGYTEDEARTVVTGSTEIQNSRTNRTGGIENG